MVFTDAEQVIVRRRAVERLERTDLRRAAAAAADACNTAAEIAKQLGIDERAVERALRDADILGVEVTPEEMILRAWVTESSREELMQALIEFPHTFLVYAPYPAEGATPSTWDQVVYAAFAGHLSRDEFDRIAAAVNPPPVE